MNEQYGIIFWCGDERGLLIISLLQG
jgi:hypothetical protein